MKRRLTNKQKQKLQIKTERRLAKGRFKTGLTPISAIIADMQLTSIQSNGEFLIISFGSDS